MAKLEAASAGARTAAAAAGLVLGATELRARIAGGEPFTSELDSIAKLAAADPALSTAVAEPLAALKPLAAAGAPSLAQLQAEFPAVATAIAQAEGERCRLRPPASPRPASGTGCWDASNPW